ncbi:serine hydrolase domain-containing protein [Actinacidiphila oryziradicis]|uniref:Beta-lactamase family protein n=1 Tax=Actinacidiphila oryziradicis TaxID=2571141 RepID=A0A4U0SJ32_9ACTN|nr:serine hydrolase domain-containing protein [Actinacidiphila oryziradicis]TKA09764.1 beta-lactamase family protein [Actinacidiphila oryziradicis]
MTSETTPPLSAGTAAEGFESLREAFDTVLAADPEHAAQVAVYADGRQVVDLWGGPLITGDSLLGVFSSTKGAAHLSVALLVQDGALDLDKEVRHYWPEFAAEGKESITLRTLITHQAGLIGTDAGFSAEEAVDDRAMAALLAAQRPFWRPGTAHGYHGMTIAALTGELVFRTTGLSLAEYYARHIGDARGVDLFIGLPGTHEHRVLDVQPMRTTAAQRAALAVGAEAPGSLSGIAFNRHRAPASADEPLPRAVLAAGPASYGGTSSARGLARMYANAISTVDGRPPLLTASTAAEFAQPHSVGQDLVLRRPTAFGLGFQSYGDRMPFLSAGAFGHDGYGGSLGFADPRTGLAFGYVRRSIPFPGGLGEDVITLAKAATFCAAAATE